MSFKCTICQKGVSKNILVELGYDVENITIEDQDAHLIVCKDHKCGCQPLMNPWCYITRCSLCKRSYCRECKSERNNISMCQLCDNILEKYFHMTNNTQI